MIYDVCIVPLQVRSFLKEGLEQTSISWLKALNVQSIPWLREPWTFEHSGDYKPLWAEIKGL